MIKTKGYTHLLGKSVMFYLNDGSNVLLKVEGESTRSIFWRDDEGLDVSVDKNTVVGSYPNE
jgi:hypothetical protein